MYYYVIILCHSMSTPLFSMFCIVSYVMASTIATRIDISLHFLRTVSMHIDCVFGECMSVWSHFDEGAKVIEIIFICLYTCIRR